MTLNLDARQRAMLHAMGITVWLPEPEAAPAAAALPEEAMAGGMPQPATAMAQPPVARPAPPATAPVQPLPVRPAPAPMPAAAAAREPEEALPNSVPAHVPHPVPAPAPARTRAPAVAADDRVRPARSYVQQPAAGAPGLGWRLGRARPVYPDALQPALTEGGWLILLEPPANTLPLPPAQRPGPDCARTALEGDAARLLDNMLRALQLERHPRVYSAALHRVVPGEAQEHPPLLQPALEAMLRDLRPACVLVLGLAAARAVLQRHEALGHLRAEPHRIADVPAVVSYDPNYLLRAPQAKAGAWADLCHAQALAAGMRIPPAAAAE